LKRLAQLCFVSYLVSIRKLKSLNLLLKNAKKRLDFNREKKVSNLYLLTKDLPLSLLITLSTLKICPQSTQQTTGYFYSFLKSKPVNATFYRTMLI